MFCGRALFIQVGTGHTVATLADASELPGVTVAQVNYSTVTDGEVTPICAQQIPLNNFLYYTTTINTHSYNLLDTQALKMNNIQLCTPL